MNPRPSPCEGDVRSVHVIAYQAGLPAHLRFGCLTRLYFIFRKIRNWDCFYRMSLTLVPWGFSSMSRENGMQRPPAFSIFTRALGENLNAATVNFSCAIPDPRTFPGTAMMSPGWASLDTCPRLRTILVRRDLPRKLATVSQMGAWCCRPARLR